MRCDSCQHQNSADALKCAQCGAVLVVVCTQCGEHAAPNARFCSQCGWSLNNEADLVAERRQLTVLFCDVVGSTGLSRVLDPEDLREVMHRYHERCAAIVQRFEGHIAQYLGDGVLIYFGYPRAHEDDGRRALRAGLELLKGMRDLKAGDSYIKIRLGVYTGLVVVGPVGVERHQHRLAVGEAPNLASKVQARAKPNTLVISESTHRLVERHFHCVDLGEHLLRGAAYKERLFRVESELDARDSAPEQPRSRLLPFVGRSEETEIILDSWQRARRGRGHVLSVRGEPGIGKSRLLQHVKAQLAAGGDRVLECRCSPYYQNTALHPVVELLNQELGLRDTTDRTAKLAKLDAVVKAESLDADAYGVLSNLLGLGDSTAPERSPQKQRQRTLEIIVRWLTNVAMRAPLLLIMEDLHWADPSTIELIRLVVERQPQQLLMVLVSRPEFDNLQSHTRVSIELNLGPLRIDDVRSMVTSLAAGTVVPDDVIDQVFERTTGIPLFVEEVTKSVLESRVLEKHASKERSSQPPSDLIPPTLRDSLTARLDRLNGTKITAQLAATLGRVFRYDLLRAVSTKSEEALRRDLSRLVEAELVLREEATQEPVYSFKHVLIRDAAYDSLLRSTRQDYHRRIVEALLRMSPDVTTSAPEIIATHYEGAGLREQAAEYWGKAGQRALGRAANREAIAHLRRGLEQLRELPETPERLEHELQLLLALTPALTAIYGWAAPDVEHACRRARELCERLGASVQLFTALWFLWTMHFLRSDLFSALKVAQDVVGATNASQIPGSEVLGHHAVGFTQFFCGRYEAAREHAEAGAKMFSEEQERARVESYQFSSTVALHAFRAASLWLLGDPAGARVALESALSLAHKLAHPPSIAFCLSFEVYLCFYERDYPATMRAAEQMLALAQSEGFLLWIAVAIVYRGWAMAADGNLQDGLEEMRRGLGLFRSSGSALTLVQIAAAFAETLHAARLDDEALSALEQGFSVSELGGERSYLPELHRLKGEILLSRPKPDVESAERSLRQALAIAREQNARPLEARAGATLLALYASQGRQGDAAALSAELTGVGETRVYSEQQRGC